jgi:hypothetical protein
MEIKDKIDIGRDFSKTPTARYRADGNDSGQKFLEDLLLPKFEKAVKDNYILLIDLENIFGFPSSFVSGSFGKLSVMKGSNLVLKHIKFLSDKNPIRIEKAIREIENPRKEDD